jgi:hypothetical protein
MRLAYAADENKMKTGFTPAVQYHKASRHCARYCLSRFETQGA